MQRISTVTVIGGLLVLAFYAGMVYSDVNHALSGIDVPNEEYNVTCYSWTENGSHNVYCPDRVYAPDSVINITVKNKSPMAN